MIQLKQFYMIASVLMVLSGIFSIWNLVSGWAIMNLPAKLSFICGNIIFQLLLAVVFYGMWKITPDMVLKDDPQLDEMLESLSKKEVK